MIIEIVLPLIVFLALVLGSITDITSREVPDSLNYFLIAAGICIRLLLSLLAQDGSIILSGILGFTLAFLLSLLLYYTGQWGGGDAKLLMGIGAMMGFSFQRDTFLFGFIINLIVVGAVYGALWSAVLFYKNRLVCMRLFKLHPLRRYDTVMWLVSIIPVIIGLFFIDFLVVFILSAILLMGSYMLIIFMKVIEEGCMIKEQKVEKLTEGDWVEKEVVVKGKKICGPTDLGLSLEQIAQLKKLKVKSILIKEGIPFVPSFLIAFLITLFVGNWFLLLFSSLSVSIGL